MRSGRGVSGTKAVGRAGEGSPSSPEITDCDGGGGVGSGGDRNEETAVGIGNGAEQRQQNEHPKEGQQAVEVEERALSKEAAFLKAAEDTDGGQGAMLFPEFVESLTRLCLARYGPRSPRTLAAVGAGATGGGGGGGGGGANGGGRRRRIGGRKTFTQGENISPRGSAKVGWLVSDMGLACAL